MIGETTQAPLDEDHDDALPAELDGVAPAVSWPPDEIDLPDVETSP